MDQKEQGYKDAINKLDKMNNMSETEVIDVAKNLLRTIILDRKQIEDKYIASRREFSDLVMKTIMDKNYRPTKKQRENDRASIMLKYVEYIKVESQLDYNRRLLQMIK